MSTIGCACDETGSCPACRKEDRWWLAVEQGDDPDLDARVERLEANVTETRRSDERV